MRRLYAHRQRIASRSAVPPQSLTRLLDIHVDRCFEAHAIAAGERRCALLHAKRHVNTARLGGKLRLGASQPDGDDQRDGACD